MAAEAQARRARDLVVEAVRVVREEWQVPLIAAAGMAFFELTLAAFGATTQVFLFVHLRSAAAERLVAGPGVTVAEPGA